MRKLIAVCVVLTLVTGAWAAGKKLGPPVEDAFWVDDVLYRTILTPTNLPDHGPKDGLYVIQGLMDQQPVGEAKPGDQDYNGGRWQVTVIQFTAAGEAVHDTDGDGYVDLELTNWEALSTTIDAVNSAVEVDVFADGQIGVQTELLRHVANSRLNRFRLANGIKSQHPRRSR